MNLSENNENSILNLLKSPWIIVPVVAISYLVIALLGHSITIPPGNISPIFPSAGIALSLALIFRRPALIGIFLGSFIYNTIFYHSNIPGLYVNMLIAAGAMTGAGIGAFLVHFFCNKKYPLTSGINVIMLIFFGIIIGCAISPFIGVLILTLKGIIPRAQSTYSFLTWWIGDILGAIIAAPLILSLNLKTHFKKNLFQLIEGFLLLFTSLIFCYYVFFLKLPAGYCLSLILVYAAFRFGMHGVSVLSVIITIIAILAASKGIILYSGNSANVSLIHLSLFLIISIICALILAGKIFEQKQSEKTLLESEGRFKSLASITTEGIMIYGENKIIEVNKAFTKMIGFEDPQDLIGKIALEIVPLTPGSKQIVLDHIRSHSTETYEIELACKDGRIISAETNGVETILNGQTVRIVRMRDISERKQNEEEKAKMESRLQQSEKMDAIGQLAGGIAHDFNNQLVGILGFADLLSYTDNPIHIKEYTGRIQDAAKRSADLTKQLLVFARKGEVETKAIDIHRIIKETIKLLERSIDKKIAIKTIFTAKPTTLIGDESLLQNAFLNLSLNARDAMPNGGTLCFETKNMIIDEEFCGRNPGKFIPGPYIQICVTDSGTGMDKETINRIFEPFFTTKGAGKGTGLGLAAVYGTVLRLNGNISCYSEPGHGTTFKLYFPLVDIDIATLSYGENITAQTRSESILIVDDEEIVRSLTSDMLTLLGHKVISFDKGAQAIEYYRNQWKQIDVVILDMIMPDLSGREVFRKLHAINKNIKVLLATGYSLNGEAQEILDEGISGFIQKPFTLKDLNEKINDIMSRK